MKEFLKEFADLLEKHDASIELDTFSNKSPTMYVWETLSGKSLTT